MKLIVFLIITCLTFPTITWSKETQAITIDEVLRLAEVNSPRLTASEFQEIAAERGIDIARSKYFPTLKLESIYDKGLPGSSATGLGVQGIMASPYRKGGTVGVTAKQLLYDFGRTAHAVKASKFQAEASKQNTKITIYEVQALALKKYYECSLFRTQRDIWEYLGGESNVITKEVHKFVDTGQRSVVDRYLSKMQTEEANGLHAYFAERLKQSIKELAIIMGVPDQNFTCPCLSRKLACSLNPDTKIESSPFLARAVLEAQVASERMEQEKSELYPEISAFGSTGYISQTRLVPKQSYAVGVGITLPIFDLNIYGKIKQSAAIAAEKQSQIEAEIQALEELNQQYDEIIKSTEVLLKKLDGELKIANDGFSLAKKRYFNLQGELVDLREAFRNLSRIRSTIADTQAQFLQASGAKALLNGS